MLAGNGNGYIPSGDLGQYGDTTRHDRWTQTPAAPAACMQAHTHAHTDDQPTDKIRLYRQKDAVTPSPHHYARLSPLVLP